jgi:hypothetical protein
LLSGGKKEKTTLQTQYSTKLEDKFKRKTKRLSFAGLKAMFWIHDILVRIQICGSVQLTDPDSDPAPDPTFFVRGWQDANKKIMFFQSFLLITFTSVIIDKKSKRNQNIIEIRFS